MAQEKTFIIQIDNDQITSIEEAVKTGKLKLVSDAEWSSFVLRALLSYHKRITMGICPELDCWERGLEYAISCVEEKIQK